MTQEDKTYKNLIDSLETEQPSMRFTKNVMDAIEGMEVAPVSKRYINPLIIKAIAAVLVLCLLASLYVVVMSADAIPDYTSKLPESPLTEHFSLYIIGINIILLMLLAERWLSSKKRIQDLQNNAQE